MFEIPKIVVLDFEGTSLGADARATEVGLVAFDESMQELGQFQTLLNPPTISAPKALEVSRLSTSMLSKAPRFSDAWPAMSAFFSNAVLVMHNKNYDLKVLSNELMAGRLMDQAPCSECTLQLSRSLVKHPSVTDYKLSTLCDYFGINNIRAHSALSDAVATSELLMRLMELDSALLPRLVDAARRGQVLSGLQPSTKTFQPELRPETQLAAPLDDATLRSLAAEIRSNSRLEYVNVTGELTTSFEEFNQLLQEIGLCFKDTPTTMKTAFLVVGHGKTGDSKIVKAKYYGRPILSELDARRLIAILQGK